MPYLPIVLTRTQSDTDAAAILAAITAAGVTPTTPMVNAAHYFVTACKWASLWSKFTAVYGLMGGTSATHAINWKTPGTFNVTWSGGLTHNSNGVTGDGTNYGDTGINARSVLSQNSWSASVYSRTTSQLSGYDFTISDGSCAVGVICRDANGANFFPGDNVAGNYSYTNSRGTGLYTVSRTASSISAGFINAVKVKSFSYASVQLPNLKWNLLGVTLPGGTVASKVARNLSFCHIGSGLTDLDALNLSWIVQATQKILSRDI